MVSPFRLALGSAALLMLGACDPSTPIDPAANLNDNFAIDIENEAIALPAPGRDPAPATSNEEPSMPSNPPIIRPPAKPATPPLAKAPTAPAPRVIVPATTQPPAEVDPVHPHPGDEVPR